MRASALLAALLTIRTPCASRGRGHPAAPSPSTTMTAAPGTTVVASMPWRLRLPGPVDDRVARSGDAVRLGSFFPILSWEPGVGWATDPPTSGFAEAATSPTADFAVTVTVSPGLGVLASG